MIILSPTARQQITDLRLHYEGLERPEAIRNLTAAIEDTAARIARAPDKGLPAPRLDPGLVSYGWRWAKAGRYWFAYVPEGGDATIAGVFHETANIPGRV